MKLDGIKTKDMVKVLDNLKITKALICSDENDKDIMLSVRNIPSIKMAMSNTINVYDILKYDTFLVTKAAVATIEEVYA